MRSISKLVVECAIRYSYKNKVNPSIIMFYRDGIGAS